VRKKRENFDFSSQQNSFFRSAENSAVESVKVVIESLQRAVARGSAFYNAGRADLCARLYFQTVAQTAQVMAELGENDATVFFAQLLFQASSAASADDAAWILRAGIERAVAWVRDSPKYAAVFEPSSSSSVDQDNQNTCAYGLLIQRVGDVVTVYETRCKTECDEDLDEIDAVFFVEESSSSSSSDVVSETEPVYGDDDVSQLATATDESDQEERQMARHRLWRSMGMCAVLGMACAVLVLMVAWRRRLQKIRRMREQAYAAQQQKRVFGAPSDPFTKTPSPLNAPYLV
jgi:hypothetical protein